MGQHLDGVGSAGRDENGRLAVRIREMRGDDGAALGVRPVGPVAQRRVKRATELGLVGTVAAPRHDRFFQAPQDRVPEHVLPVFLADIRHVAAAVDDTGPAGEILGIGEQRAPLRLQQIDDPQILAPLLELDPGLTLPDGTALADALAALPEDEQRAERRAPLA